MYFMSNFGVYAIGLCIYLSSYANLQVLFFPNKIMLQKIFKSYEEKSVTQKSSPSAYSHTSISQNVLVESLWMFSYKQNSFFSYST